MKSTRTLTLTTVALGLAMFFGTSEARAQFQLHPWQWGPTYHNLTFTSVSNVQDVNWTQYYLYLGQVTFNVGFTFVGTTASGQSYTVAILGPGGNIIGSRVGATERDMMRHVVEAFRDNSPILPRPASLRRREVSVHVLHDDVLVEDEDRGRQSAPSDRQRSQRWPDRARSQRRWGLLRRGEDPASEELRCERQRNDRSERAEHFQEIAISALRNTKSFILNRQTTFSPVNAVSAALAIEFVRIAVEGVPFLDVSGAIKLEDNDPYHLSGNDSCLTSTYLLDNNVLING